MFRWFGLLLLQSVPLAASPPDALAQEVPPMPSDCVAIAAQIEIETHARFMRKSTSTLFYDPGLPSYSSLPNGMTVSCPPWALGPQSYSVALDWEQGSVPPKAFYDLAGRAGAILTGERPEVLSDASRHCHQKALNSKFEISVVLTPKAKIECQAFARDGGAANVSIWHRTPDDEEAPQDEATPDKILLSPTAPPPASDDDAMKSLDDCTSVAKPVCDNVDNCFKGTMQ
jgi:hypothetical protein